MDYVPFFLAIAWAQIVSIINLTTALVDKNNNNEANCQLVLAHGVHVSLRMNYRKMSFSFSWGERSIKSLL